MKLETLEKMDAWKFERKPLGITLCSADKSADKIDVTREPSFGESVDGETEC